MVLPSCCCAVFLTPQRIAVQQPNLQRVMIECGPWTGCALEDCPQRQVCAGCMCVVGRGWGPLK